MFRKAKIEIVVASALLIVVITLTVLGAVGIASINEQGDSNEEEILALQRRLDNLDVISKNLAAEYKVLQAKIETLTALAESGGD